MSKQHSSLQKPCKVWSSDRQTRKSITASSLNEFIFRGALKLGYGQQQIAKLRVVLENDGTEVEDDAYFQATPRDTTFLLLRDNETWLPPGIDALKTALSAIPQIVCDTINSMKLANKAPTWSIKDDQGYITITLQWEHGDQQLQSRTIGGFVDLYDEELSTTWKPSTSSYAQFTDRVYSSTFPRPTASRAKSETYARAAKHLGGYRTATVPFKTLSAEDFSFIDRVDDFSSAYDLTSFCDFHCSSLHRDGGSIKVSKSVGTSPISDFSGSRAATPIPHVATQTSRTTSPFESLPETATPATIAQVPIVTAATAIGAKAKKGHVRFLDLDKAASTATAAEVVSSDQQLPVKSNISLLSMINGQVDGAAGSSDESETETTEREDEQLFERYLLLNDQLSANQKKHLSIKDIGFILERLSTKIVDVDKLEREKESSECYNWLIKATIRGDMLREIGVIYNGQYYSLMEHPGYF